MNLTIREGEFVSVVGPSGCGKSTLLKVASGLLKPAEGEALLDGKRIDGVTGEVGMVFQNDALLPWKTVFDTFFGPCRTAPPYWPGVMPSYFLNTRVK
ncbi:ATP-binding cassette domain-containing protein [Paenibacillus naphthalenovorans]|uniref:ATP-binding cassette domain-containing protein n=1 Tax=Paenibacillus naphthalenovorans TaxID=162209 RepID=UPI00088C6A22|nr:ATP-binding cassette domain-containing protein [Paenibacillus naphthalenovorans]SDJ78812.1 NitT/TauT family transport system ATP-binding protein [Paenibacillus naphthalenovorans]